MKKTTKAIITVHALVMLSGCGKSEIDKCVEVKIINYLSDPGKIAGPCLSICKVPAVEESVKMTETEKDVIGACLDGCLSKAAERKDVKQSIMTKHEAEIRLECLRAASGKN
jgi:hypothetical protein